MRKKYSFLVLILLMVSISSAYSQAKKVSFTLHDLTNERLNESYADSEGNSIAFSTHSPGIILVDGELVHTRSLLQLNPLECWGENSVPSGRYTWAKFTLGTLFETTKAPYILIDLGEETNSVVGFEMAAKGSGVLSSVISSIGISFSATLDLRQNYGLGLSLSVGGGACSNSANSYISIPTGTRYIRISSDPLLAGLNLNLSALLNPLEIYAFRFYANDPLNLTAISPANDSENVWYASPITLTFDRAITVYDMDEISLNGESILTAGGLSVSGNTLTITHPPFTPDTEVSLTIGALGVRGIFDQALLEKDTTITFTTLPPLLEVVSNTLQFTTAKNIARTVSLDLTAHSYLSSLSLSNATAVLTGTNLNVFTVEPFDKAQFISNLLLSGEASLDITYMPTDDGPHEASLLLTLLTDQNVPISLAVTLEGEVSSVVSIEDEEATKVIADESYYTIWGAQVANPEDLSLYIKKTRYTDGSVKIEKVYFQK